MFKIKAITPKKIPFNSKGMKRVVDNVIKQTSVAVQADFNVTTQTWKKRPTFLIKKMKTGAEIYTTNLIYHFVSGGTRVRYATMTPNFKPKTRFKYIASYKGRGGVMFISRKRPRPGIKGRKLDIRIGEKWNKRLPEQFRRAIATELDRAG